VENYGYTAPAYPLFWTWRSETMALDLASLSAETIIFARWIVPVVPAGRVLEDHALAISSGRIVAIVPATEARDSLVLNASHTPEIFQLDNHILLPGLINSHGHAAMSLLRGYADDTALMTWLQDHIWPAEARHVSAPFVIDGTQLAMAEMIRSGTTCFSDMYFFPDQTARLAAAAGLRAQIAFPILDFPSAWASGPDEYLAKGAALCEAYADNPLISPVFGPHSTYTVSEAVLERIARLAADQQCAIHIHMQETAGEVDDCIDSSGLRPLELLDRVGALSSRTQCVHMTQVSDSDLDLLLQRGAQVVHCPNSNMKLASGSCPTAVLREAGVNVALGTDGAASNNSIDMFAEMRSAALLAKLSCGEASALPARQVLEMATINGARAMGMDTQTGSLEPGKAADLIAVDMHHPGSQPVYDAVSQLVYATSSHQVSHNWVAGRNLLRDGVLTELSASSIMAAAETWQTTFANTQQD
jgi:5-methylthioadenosine/S-adenosylhomocysteine deaminase